MEGKLLDEKKMRRITKKIGWEYRDGEDICPECLGREAAKHLLHNGHFTAGQLLAFSSATKDAREDLIHGEGDGKFLCPICHANVSIQDLPGADRYTAICPGCGVNFRKE